MNDRIAFASLEAKSPRQRRLEAEDKARRLRAIERRRAITKAMHLSGATRRALSPR